MGETIVFVYDASGKLVAEYSTVVESAENAKVAYLTNDHLGSPRIKTDKNGSVISRNDYLPYGEDLYTTQRTQTLGYTSDTIRQQFTGYQNDDETGLDYAQARTYANQMGRYTTSDRTMRRAAAIPQSWNRYSYCLNRPFIYYDKDGRWPTVIHDLIIRLALPNLSWGQIRAIQVGSYSVDVPWTVFSQYASQHAMRRPGQSVENAETEMQAFVANKNTLAKSEALGPFGPSERSLNYFGQAVHPLTDNWSPAHRYFQEYDDSDLLDCAWNPFACARYWDGITQHKNGESTISESELASAISAVRDNYSKVYGVDALKKATGIFGNGRYTFGGSAFGILIDGNDSPDRLDAGNLGTVTVHADGSESYDGPLVKLPNDHRKRRKGK